MSQADEIQRLAELRDRGVLSEKEFNRAKTKILNGGRPAPSRFMTAVAAVVAIMIIAGFVSKLVTSPQADPASPAPSAAQSLEAAPPAHSATPATTPESEPADLEWGPLDLACDLPEIKDKVTLIVNLRSSALANQMGAGEMAHRIQIQGILTTTELHRNPETGFIACSGATLHSEGEGVIGYTVAWTDRNTGEFWVEVASAESLSAQYSAAE